MAQNKLYVGNLTFGTDDAALHQLFAEHGGVASAQVVMDRETGRSRGFGFVEMQNEAGAKSALSLDGQMIDGRKIVVNVAKPREDRGGRGGRF